MEGDGYLFKPMAYARSCYVHCQGVPRQPGLVPLARSRIEIEEWVPPPTFDDLSSYSHIWVIFVFHMNTNISTLQKSQQEKGVTFPVSLLERVCSLGKSASSPFARQKHGTLRYTHSAPSMSHRLKRGEARRSPRLGQEALLSRFE